MKLKKPTDVIKKKVELQNPALSIESVKGLSHLGHLRNIIYASRRALGDVGSDARSRAAPQDFGIHKIFARHLRDVQMTPKWDRTFRVHYDLILAVAFAWLNGYSF